MLAELIETHASEAAAKSDWESVSKTLNALRQTVNVGRVGGKASLAALVQNGIDPNQVIAAMRSVPMASELLNTLTASGVDWADDLTAFVMSGLVSAGKITQQTVDVMRSLSVRSVAVVETTATQCEGAWAARLSQIKRMNRRTLFDAFENAVGSDEYDAKKAELIAALEAA